MKENQKKFKLYFISNILISITLLVFVLFILFNIESYPLLNTILLILSLILVFLLLKSNERFLYYKHEKILSELLHQKQGVLSCKKKFFDESFFVRLKNELGFQLFKNTSKFGMYYKVDKGLRNARKHKTLYAILFIYDDISFLDKKCATFFESLEDHVSKESKYFRQVFLQVKVSKRKITSDDINDVDNIFYLSTKNNSIAVLNILYAPLQNELYYLRNSKVFLPGYLKVSYQLIEQLLN